MKYRYGKIQKLSESLLKNGVDPETYGKIMKDGEGIRQTDKNVVKAHWLREAMEAMDVELPAEKRQMIRQDCACCLTGKRHAICKKIHQEFATTSERIKAGNAAHYVFGHGLREIATGRYEVSFFPEEYTEKACPCIRELDQKMSITYCYCCGGHVKHHLQTLLGIPLKVKVISSVLSSQGKQNCRFELTEL